MNKPKFDPSKPFSVVGGKPKFDPSKPFEAVEMPGSTSLDLSAPVGQESQQEMLDRMQLGFKQNKDPNIGKAFIQGLGKEATLGYLPEIQAGAQRMLPNPTAEADLKLKALGIEAPQENLTQQFRARQEQLQKENPVAFGAGQAVGIGGQLAATSGAANVLGAGGLIKASPVLSSVLESGAMGAAYNPTETKDSRLKSGLIGAGTAGVLGLAGKGVAAAGEKLDDFGKFFLRKGIGIEGKSGWAKVAKSDLDPDEVARFAYDKGIFKEGIKAEKMFAQAEKIKNDIGQKIGAFSTTAEGQIPKFDTLDIANDVMNSISSEVRGTSNGIQIEKAARNELENFLNKPDKLPLTEIDEYRQQIQKQILGIGKQVSEKDSASVQAKNFIREKLNDVLLDTVEKTAGTAKKADLLALKNDYRKALAIHDAAFNKLASEKGLNLISLRGSMGLAQGIGDIAENPQGFLGKAAGAMVMPLLTSRTATKAAAVATPKIGQGLMKVGSSQLPVRAAGRISGKQ